MNIYKLSAHSSIGSDSEKLIEIRNTGLRPNWNRFWMVEHGGEDACTSIKSGFPSSLTSFKSTQSVGGGTVMHVRLITGSEWIGVIYEGTMKAGMFDGVGVLRYPNGGSLEGLWHEGTLKYWQYEYADGLERDNQSWMYCSMPDRRFHSDHLYGLRSASTERLTNMYPPRELPPGHYDAGPGFYNPQTKCVVDAVTGEVLSIPTLAEEKWIVERCRSAEPIETVGYRPQLYENWSTQRPMDEEYSDATETILTLLQQEGIELEPLNASRPDYIHTSPQDKLDGTDQIQEYSKLIEFGNFLKRVQNEIEHHKSKHPPKHVSEETERRPTAVDEVSSISNLLQLINTFSDKINRIIREGKYETTIRRDTTSSEGSETALEHFKNIGRLLSSISMTSIKAFPFSHSQRIMSSQDDEVSYKKHFHSGESRRHIIPGQSEESISQKHTLDSNRSGRHNKSDQDEKFIPAKTLSSLSGSRRNTSYQDFVSEKKLPHSRGSRGRGRTISVQDEDLITEKKTLHSSGSSQLTVSSHLCGEVIYAEKCLQSIRSKRHTITEQHEKFISEKDLLHSSRLSRRTQPGADEEFMPLKNYLHCSGLTHPKLSGQGEEFIPETNVLRCSRLRLPTGSHQDEDVLYEKQVLRSNGSRRLTVPNRDEEALSKKQLSRSKDSRRLTGSNQDEEALSKKQFSRSNGSRRLTGSNQDEEALSKKQLSRSNGSRRFTGSNQDEEVLSKKQLSRSDGSKRLTGLTLYEEVLSNKQLSRSNGSRRLTVSNQDEEVLPKKQLSRFSGSRQHTVSSQHEIFISEKDLVHSSRLSRRTLPGQDE